MDYMHRSEHDDRRRSNNSNKYRDDRFSRSYHDRDDNGGDMRRRSRSRSREDRFSRDYSNSKRHYGNGEHREERRHHNQTPSKTIMVRQIPFEMSEDDLRTEFNMVQVPYKNIRLVKHRENGQSRGFAFVEFGTVDEASRWMASNQGQFQLSNMDARVALFFSHTEDYTFRSDHMSSRRSNGSYNSSNSSEWTCSQCDVKNFKRRDRCFKCNITREESEKRTGGEGYEHVGSTPCNTLVLRGLDALTVEETIVDTLNRLSNRTLSVKTCHIARDPITHVSDGFAIVEMNTIQDATYMLDVLAPSFEVDGKQIMANYSKNSFKTVITQLQNSSTMAQQQQQTAAAFQHIMQPTGGYASYAATAGGTHHYHQSASNNLGSNSIGVSQGDRVNSAAAVAQAALFKMQKKQEILNQFTNNLKQASTQETSVTPQSVDSSIGANLQLLAQQVKKTYTPPDPSKFTFDKASGYYYDFTTGFYFDAGTQYYYNPLTQQFMYWDPINFTYVPVATTTPASTVDQTAKSESENGTTTTNGSNEEKAAAVVNKQPVKTAAQIAKDMEKWAQSQNKKKEATKKTTITITAPSTLTSNQQPLSSSGNAESFKATGMFESLSKSASGSISISSISSSQSTLDNNMKKTTAPFDAAHDAASNSGDSDNSNEQKPPASTRSSESVRAEERTPTSTLDESSLIDLTKMACLLCKRKFDTVEVLNKHVAKSDLHKTNLEKLRKESQDRSKQEEDDSLAVALQYRDRAKERRKKYGTPEPPSPTYPSSSSSKSSKPPKHKSDRDHSNDESHSTKSSVQSGGGDSIANKLMRKMGWNGETGIGKNLQGISAPIEATMRQKGAGLGAANYDLDPNDTYQEAVKRAARARFESLNS